MCWCQFRPSKITIGGGGGGGGGEARGRVRSAPTSISYSAKMCTRTYNERYHSVRFSNTMSKQLSVGK